MFDASKFQIEPCSFVAKKVSFSETCHTTFLFENLPDPSPERPRHAGVVDVPVAELVQQVGKVQEERLPRGVVARRHQVRVQRVEVVRDARAQQRRRGRRRWPGGAAVGGVGGGAGGGLEH